MSAIPRNDGESFEDYKVRRAADHDQTKKALKGKLFWDSFYEGTYIRKTRKYLSLKALKIQLTKGK